jgi:hypothetical protein
MPHERVEVNDVSWAGPFIRLEAAINRAGKGFDEGDLDRGLSALKDAQRHLNDVLSWLIVNEGKL